MYVLYDGARKKAHSVITLFFVCCLWWSKRKNSFGHNIIFSLLSIMEEEKKLILLQHYFFSVVYDGAREKAHSVTSLFFVCSLWWTKRTNSFCYNLIFCMLCMMEEEKKHILLWRYFLYVLYDGAWEITDSVITLFFVCCLWWSKRRNSFC